MSIRKKIVKSTNLKKYPKGYYEVYEVSFSYEEDGVKKRIQKTFKKSKEAKEFQTSLITSYETEGCIHQECKKTLDQVYEEFLEVGSIQYQENTIYNTKKVYKAYIKDKLGSNKIISLNYATLQKYFNSRSKFGIETNKEVKKALNRIFIYAQRLSYIKENPITLVTVTGIENHKENTNDVLSDEQIEDIISILDEVGTFKYQSFISAIQIARYTGMRLSEVLALEKGDVDLIDDVIYINKKLVYKGLKKEELHSVEKLKTKTSKATIPMTRKLKSYLLDWFKINPYDLICCDESGGFIIPKSFEKSVNDLMKKNNFEYRFHFHELRHTYSTNLVNSGVDLKTAQELMRHSNIQTTMNVYTHVNNQSKLEALNKVFN